jgi:hypothetical protein
MTISDHGVLSRYFTTLPGIGYESFSIEHTVRRGVRNLVHIEVPTDDDLSGISRADFFQEHFRGGTDCASRGQRGQKVWRRDSRTESYSVIDNEQLRFWTYTW